MFVFYLPAHLVQYKGACIQDCGHGMMVKDRKCVECDGPCPKSMLYSYKTNLNEFYQKIA